MARIILIAVISSFLVVPDAISQTKAWRGLVPLHSTKNDVERLVGKPVPDKHPYSATKYEIDGGTVSIDFANSRCDEGWNVPKDTVLRISVEPFGPPRKTEAEFGFVRRKQFPFRGDTPDPKIWIDPEKGIEYAFHQANEYRLFATTYIPKIADNELRCDGFPPYAPEGSYMWLDRLPFYTGRPSERFSKSDYAFRVAALVAEVENNPDYRGFVVIYFDRRRPFTFYKEKFDELKKYVYGRRKDSAKTLTFIEGGYQDQAMLETYLISRDDPPPTPRPSYPSPEFMRKRRLTRSNN